MAGSRRRLADKSENRGKSALYFLKLYNREKRGNIKV